MIVIVWAAFAAFLVWLALVGVSATFGGLTSLFTGDSKQLPTWNGWSYFLFCAKEGAMFGAILTWPIALIAFVVALIVFRRRVYGTFVSSPRTTKTIPER